MNTLTALKRSSLGLDLYLWLVYRTFALRAPKRLTWRLLYSQFGAHPANASDRVTVRNFQRKVLRELKKIKIALAWPELFNGSGRLDPASLDPGHRAAQSRSANKLISPFLTSQRPVSGLCAPGWTPGYPPRLLESSSDSGWFWCRQRRDLRIMGYGASLDWTESSICRTLVRRRHHSPLPSLVFSLQTKLPRLGRDFR